MTQKIIIIVSVLLLAWIAWSLLSSSVEQAKYEVLEKRNGYEIRKYSPQLVAQVLVEGDFNNSMNKGFSLIAGYIFGKNKEEKNIAMTAPVLEQEIKGTNIAMTAPVTEENLGSGRIVQFVMPSEYSIDTIPRPVDSRVELKEVPSRTFAAYKFSWYYGEKRVEGKKKYFLELLESEDLNVIGNPVFAGYNAPWTIPFLMRNEILVEIDYQK